MARLELRLLGGFQARLGAGPPLTLPAKAQALLAYLALRPGVAHPRDKIATLLWGGTTDEQARNNLRHTVFTLRKALGAAASALEVDGQMLAVDAKASDVDVPTFERLVADGTPDALERAVALYEGDLLEGVRVDEPPFEEWLLAERERLREMAVDVLTRLLAQQMKEPATERAIQTALRLVAIEPVQESVHRTLMRLYARQGRRGSALRQYQICVAVLQRELGAEPEAETKQLYQDILRGRPAESRDSERLPTHPVRQRPRAVAARPTIHIHIDEAPLIGRTSELARLREALDEVARGHGQVVVVVGEAGIGKSRMLSSRSPTLPTGAAPAPCWGVPTAARRSCHSGRGSMPSARPESLMTTTRWAVSIRSGEPSWPGCSRRFTCPASRLRATITSNSSRAWPGWSNRWPPDSQRC